MSIVSASVGANAKGEGVIVRVDDRVGSVHLAKPLASRLRTYGARVVVERMRCADVAFPGVGRDGSAKRIGVELKRLSSGDFVTSMTSGRLGGFQLPSLSEDFDVVYVIVEGFMREGDEGVLDLGQWGGRRRRGGRPIMYASVLGFMASLEDVGVRVRRTMGASDTAATITQLVRRWQRAKHTSVEGAIYFGDRESCDVGGAEIAPIRRPGFALEFARRLPGVGPAKGGAVLRAFPTTDDMHAATKREWAMVEWRDRRGKLRKLGPVVGERIWRQLRTQEDI